MLRIMFAMSLLAGPLVAVGAGDSIEAMQADQKFFTDTSCCQLKKGVKPRDLVAFRSEVLKSAAGGMLDGPYDRAYRAASYHAYPSPRELGRTLKLGEGFSRYENIRRPRNRSTRREQTQLLTCREGQDAGGTAAVIEEKYAPDQQEAAIGGELHVHPAPSPFAQLLPGCKIPQAA